MHDAEASPATARQIPAFHAAILGEKRRAHALVIPVINEGGRIRAQLQRLAELAPAVDIVIADGGSTDGSLDEAFLRGVGVRALLVKTGPGKLGAQLRMAYAWCLDQGYDGIITVDGNNKDGMEAVSAFVDELAHGFDLVQGSRFLKGGEAVNTPLDRHVANRLIHAPLISAAAGHWYTDTTNGFRAYSRGLLEDPRVAPFREVFDRYGLLFYLSVRAPQLDYQVTEIPVRRAYPASEKAPTKIAGLSGKVAILEELFRAVTGGYAPGPARSSPLSAALLLVLPLLAVAILALRHAQHPFYEPDSWFYFELSRSIFGDFYRVVTERSFNLPGPYSAAFPPLWPSLIALTDVLTGLGARSGYILSFTAFGMTCAFSEWAARTFYRIRWAGLAAALSLLLLPGYRYEVLGGCSIPLQVLFYAVMLAIFLRADMGRLVPVIGLGLLAGLSVLLRFDTLPFALLLAVAMLIRTRRLVPVVLYAGAVLVTMSPWIVYSLERFGVPFITDNGLVAMAVDRAVYATDWRPEGVSTLADDPLGWLRKVAINSARLIVFMGDDLMPSLVVLALVLRLVRLDGSGWRELAVAGWRSEEARRAGLFALAMAGPLAGYVATGYLIGRYYSPWQWLILMLAVAIGAAIARSPSQRQVLGAFALQTVAVLALVTAFADPAGDRSAFPRTAPLDTLHACLANPERAAVLVVGNDSDASQFGAIYGVRSLMMPRNLRDIEPAPLARFMTARGVTHVYAADPVAIPALTALPGLRRTHCDVPLFEVDGR